MQCFCLVNVFLSSVRVLVTLLVCWRVYSVVCIFVLCPCVGLQCSLTLQVLIVQEMTLFLLHENTLQTPQCYSSLALT